MNGWVLRRSESTETNCLKCGLYAVCSKGIVKETLKGLRPFQKSCNIFRNFQYLPITKLKERRF